MSSIVGSRSMLGPTFFQDRLFIYTKIVNFGGWNTPHTHVTPIEILGIFEGFLGFFGNVYEIFWSDTPLTETQQFFILIP